jgi:hypothetical protein
MKKVGLLPFRVKKEYSIFYFIQQKKPELSAEVAS